MKIKYKYLLLFSVIYIYIPIVIFLLGWTKLYIALPCLLALTFCAYRVIRSVRKSECLQLEIDAGVFAVSIIFFTWIGYICGWGRFVDQVDDWGKHNAILADLVQKSWPVYYHNGDESSMLSYYIAQYLLPAGVGKMLKSFKAAELFLYFWNVLGVELIFLNLISYLKLNKRIWQIVSMTLIPFYSVPIWLIQYILSIFTKYNYIENNHWVVYENEFKLQYPSNWIMFRWVFPQVIVLWIILLIFLANKDKIEYYLPLMLPAILYGSLSFLGLIPVSIAYAIEYFVKNKNVKAWIKKIFSVENIISFATLGSVIALYFYGNVFGEKPDTISFGVTHFDGSRFTAYIVFELFAVGAYVLVLGKEHKGDGIFLASVITLVLLPLVHMGYENDLTVRACIPALLYIMLMLIDYLNHFDYSHIQEMKISKRLGLLIIIVFIAVGMHYPFKEISWVAYSEAGNYLHWGTDPKWGTLEQFANRKLDIYEDIQYNYYVYDLEDNLFYKYVAR